jgi:hypothetical protein
MSEQKALPVLQELEGWDNEDGLPICLLHQSKKFQKQVVNLKTIVSSSDSQDEEGDKSSKEAYTHSASPQAKAKSKSKSKLRLGNDAA